MKKLYILLLAAMAWGSALAQDNAFYFTDAFVLLGSSYPSGIELCIRNASTDLTCFEAEIQLPEGLSPVLDEDGNPIVVLYRNRSTVHEVLANVLDNGNLKLLISSVDGALFKGNDGPFLSFHVQADDDAQSGEYTVETVGESLLVNTNAEAFYNVGVKGYVLVSDDPTSIKTTDNGQQATGKEIYNLAGQRLSKTQKGINIVGGKKVLGK